MEDRERAMVFFVDDHEDVRDVVRSTLQDLDVDVLCMSSPGVCLKILTSQHCELLITDVIMPEMNGLDFLKEVKKVAPLLPAIVVSGYGDVGMAVRAMKAGAVDFIEKPLSRKSLQSAVRSALGHVPRDDRIPASVLPLTDIERKTLSLILAGKSNREIAEIRHRSKRTVEDERGRIMKKLRARNIIDLVHITSAMGMFDEA